MNVKELKGKGSKRQEENVLPKFQNKALFNPVTNMIPLFTQAQNISLKTLHSLVEKLGESEPLK